MKCFIGLIKISVETIGEKENGEKNKGEGGGDDREKTRAGWEVRTRVNKRRKVGEEWITS